MKRFALPLLAAALLSAVPVFADPTPQRVSNINNSVLYNADGTVRGDFYNTSWQKGYGMNGGHYTERLFDGDYENYCYLWDSGCYIIVDLTSLLSTGYYVTEIKIGHSGDQQYSLYYSTESSGSQWTPIIESSSVAGRPRTFTVEHMAKRIKYVFDTAVKPTTGLGELEVLGIDPAEFPPGTCFHPEESLTEWESIPGTANCTDYGYEQQQCTACGEWFRRESLTMLPIGHEYETFLTRPGTGLSFGTGSNVCSRCGHAIVFDEPLDLVSLGGFSAPGIIQFTDISVSSTYPSWAGIRTTSLIDNNWTMAWGSFWAAASKDHDEFVEFAFNTEIDLTKVKFSVPNHSHIIEFYSVADGEETLIDQVSIVEETGDGAPEYQIIEEEFRDTSLSTLRIRTIDSIGYNVGGFNLYTMAFSEIRPYGTVKGAGKTLVRTRIIIE